MGCSFTRENSNHTWELEEKAIASAEAYLNISSVKASHLLKEFNKNRNGQGFSNQNQFLDAANALLINTEGFTEEKTPIHNFYRCFEVSYCLYDTRKLCVLGVLLGEGNIANKIAILFEQFDRDASGNIDYMEFIAMLTIIIEISLVYLPSLAIELAKDSTIKNRLSKYAKRLSIVTRPVVLYFRYLIITGVKCSLCLSELIEALEEPELVHLFSTAKLRSIGYEKYHTVVLKAKLVREYFNKKPSTKDIQYLDKVDESNSEYEDSKLNDIQDVMDVEE